MIKVYQSVEKLSEHSAELFIMEAREAIAKRGRFCVSLSGGSTPRLLYEKLAKAKYSSRVDWKKVYIFWGDERHVPKDHELSNQKMTEDAWLSHSAVPRENIFPIPFKESAEVAARQYEEDLRRFFGKLPRFDLTLLGVGKDGHTASLFPGTAALDETKHWVSSARPESGGPERLTLTFPVLNESAKIWFLAAGSEKAEILKQVFAEDVPDLPVKKIVPKGPVTWFIDEAAAKCLAKQTIKEA